MTTIMQLRFTDTAFEQCRMLRRKVFIEEQHVPEALEWDDADATATHLLVMEHGKAVACARVLPDGHIGRMAVLPYRRGTGLGTALLQQAVVLCRKLRCSQAKLSAQMHAIGFYQRAGFVVVSTPYLDANIPHVDMVLELL